MTRNRMAFRMTGIALLAGAMLIVLGGTALAVPDNARSFTASNCTSDTILNLYCSYTHVSPPPGCRGEVTVCPGNSTHWAACPVGETTNVTGPFFYSFDYSFLDGAGILQELEDSGVPWQISLGFFNSTHPGVFHPRFIDYGSFNSPGMGNFNGTFTNSTAFFQIPAGGRAGLEFSLSLLNGTVPGCVNLIMDSSLYVNVTSTNPPYPICSGEAIPTMTQWGMLLMSFAIAVAGAFVIRRKVARSAKNL